MNINDWREHLNGLVDAAKAEIMQADDGNALDNIAYDYLDSKSGRIGKHQRGLQPIYILKEVETAIAEVESQLEARYVQV